MSRRWQVFWLVELALLFGLGFEIVTNPPIFLTLLLGLLAVWLGTRVHHGREVWLTAGTIAVIVAVFINPIVWVMLFLGAVAVLKYANGAHGFGPWAKKQFVAVATTEPTPKAGKSIRHPWVGEAHIGTQLFEWDDINLTVAAGDTIIDLGNTILPKGDNHVVIRKGCGKTRILVPVGVGVMVSHSGAFGTLTMANHELPVHMETVTQYSDDYDTATRRVHILTNVAFGDVEVLAV